MSSFRPEATWQYLALIFTIILGKKMGKQINVDASMDNLTLVKTVKKICQNNPPHLYSKNDSDLISEVVHLI